MTPKSRRRRTSTAWPWCSPAFDTSGTDDGSMRILIIGSGGREHALAWKCASSPRVSEVLVAPGNAGTATEPRVRNAQVQADDFAGLIGLARAEHIDLTIIGPEGPLVAGVVDAFEAAGLKCFGPRRACAQLA